MLCEHCGHEHEDCGRIQESLRDEIQLIRLSVVRLETHLEYWLRHPALRRAEEDAVRAGHERLLAAVKETP